MEILKLHWRRMLTEYGYSSFFAKFPYMEGYFKIEVFFKCDKKGKRIKESETFFLHRADIRINGGLKKTKKHKCKSLEDAKQTAQGMCLKWIAKTYCEKPVSRRILFEKSKKKIPRKKINTDRQIRLEVLVHHNGVFWEHTMI